jgi:very-short-patch-repair endonuclease
MENLHKDANSKLFGYARENRQKQTVAETLLWENLRNRQLKGFKFRRQHPIGKFIADFYCHECNLVIEIDGRYHLQIEQADYDEGRTYELMVEGLRVIRFRNEEVRMKLDWVLDEISKTSSLALLLKEKGEREPSPSGEGRVRFFYYIVNFIRYSRCHHEAVRICFRIVGQNATSY